MPNAFFSVGQFKIIIWKIHFLLRLSFFKSKILEIIWNIWVWQAKQNQKNICKGGKNTYSIVHPT